MQLMNLDNDCMIIDTTTVERKLLKAGLVQLHSFYEIMADGAANNIKFKTGGTDEVEQNTIKHCDQKMQEITVLQGRLEK